MPSQTSPTDPALKAGSFDLNRSSLKETAYHQIKQLIVDGEIPAGTLISERQLVGRLGMSKTPIRTALERLDSEGFVKVSPQQGIVVRQPSLQEIADQFEIRAILESHVVATLAGRLSKLQIARLQANLDEQQECVVTEDLRRAVLLDMEFHIMYAQFHRNKNIQEVLMALGDKMKLVILRVLEGNPQRMPKSVAEHTAIANAVIQGEAELAASLLRNHLEFGKVFLTNREEF